MRAALVTGRSLLLLVDAADPLSLQVQMMKAQLEASSKFNTELAFMSASLVVGEVKIGKAASRDPRRQGSGSASHRAACKTFEDTIAEWCRLDTDTSPSSSPSSKSASTLSLSSQLSDLNHAIKEEPSQAGPIRARMDKRKTQTTPPGILKQPTAPNGFKIHESA